MITILTLLHTPSDRKLAGFGASKYYGGATELSAGSLAIPSIVSGSSPHQKRT